MLIFCLCRVEKEKGQLIIEIDNLQGINEALGKGKVSKRLCSYFSIIFYIVEICEISKIECYVLTYLRSS